MHNINFSSETPQRLHYVASRSVELQITRSAILQFLYSTQVGYR